MTCSFRQYWMAGVLAVAAHAPVALAQETTVEPQSLTTAEQMSSAEAVAGVANIARTDANEAEVLAFGPGAPGAQALIGTGYTYSHDWGDRRGQWILNLNWGVVRNNSRVFASASECRPGGGKFIGAARYTVHNVAQTTDRVSVWVNIDWSSDIRLCVDYLVINP